ncbi:hypothetical protein N0V95_007577 [Ascochyta clinopodiicola]|nr:hypothetical protein N0V95_007577 [Ascochyta clinopodiicola]
MTKVIEHLIAASSGVAAHQHIFIQGEWHLHVPEILLSHTLAFTLTSLLFSATQVFPLLIAYATGLFTSITLYRILFHRTRHFPGPRLASITKLWHVFQSRNSTNYLVLQRLHEEYGDLVRTGPNEITIFRADAAELLDGYKNTNTRDVWYDILHPRKALVFARNKEEMRLLRGSWSQAVSSKCLNKFTPRILRLADGIVESIRSRAKGAPVLLNDVMSWFAFDAMGEITFGKDFAFVEPNEFIPERWTTKPELVLDARAYAPFSVGPHQCIGKAISHLELRVVTAKLLLAFDASVSSEPGQDLSAFWKGMKDQVTMMPGELWCVFVDRNI